MRKTLVVVVEVEVQVAPAGQKQSLFVLGVKLKDAGWRQEHKCRFLQH